MNLIDSLTSEPNQTFRFLLEDGSAVSFQLIYRPAIQRWSLYASYKNWSVNGIILACHFNILRTWREVIPFGIAIVSEDNIDPIAVDDFSTGRVSFFILNSDDVSKVEASLVAA